MNAAALSLWLATATEERAAALDDLVGSGDLIAVENDAGELALIRADDRLVTRLEAGSAPVLPAALA